MEIENKQIEGNNNTANKMPVSLLDIIKEIKFEVKRIKNNTNFTIKSSGLIINTDGKGCKGYCEGSNNIPNICGKGGLCQNLSRANSIIKKTSDFEHEQTLKNIY